MKTSFLPAEKINSLLQFEPFLALLLLAFSAWVLYRILLRDVSQERHRNLQNQFKDLAWNCLIFTALFIAHLILSTAEAAPEILTSFTPYFGLLCLFMGATVLVKSLRTMTLEYLFLGHMKVGVPLLLVNLFTLLISLVVVGWFLTEIFNFKIAPLLATSAIFSIVLGLALQDTLGNLFAGVALQIDKPYEIGHWVEVQSGPLKWVGQIHEISWRSTVLLGLSDELMTIPNRVMAQAEISNYSARNEPISRVQFFKIAHGGDIERAQKVLFEAALAIPEVCREPKPMVFCSEYNENGITLKLVYSISDFGAQFRLQDRILKGGAVALQNAGLEAARTRYDISGKVQS
jgi:small-conductance mechanosensitive channel